MKCCLRFLLLTAATIIVAACAMGPDYERPEVPVPETYETETIPGVSFANLEWWELFDDAELVALIETALINNKELAIAMARIEEARASLGFVRADQFPNLDAGAGAARGNVIPGAVVPGSINETFVLAANLSFEVDLWGKLRRSTEAARAELLATVEARNVVTITLISDVAGFYLLLLDLDERLEIARRTKVTRQDSLRHGSTDRRQPGTDRTCRCSSGTGCAGTAAGIGEKLAQRVAGPQPRTGCQGSTRCCCNAEYPGNSGWSAVRTAGTAT